jgi:hypothetical protein
MELKQFIKTLPSSYDGFTISQYMPILDLQLNDDVTSIIDRCDDMLQIAATIGNTDIKYLTALPIQGVGLIIDRLSFLALPPVAKPPNFKLAELSGISYDKYLMLIPLLAKPLHNLPKIINLLQKDNNKSDEDIMNLNLCEAIYLIEDLKKKSIKFKKHSQLKAMKRTAKQIRKQAVTRLRYLRKKSA